MKGNTEVIKQLNKLLTGELTAMDIYLLLSKICEDLGMNKLSQRFNHEVDDERAHADLLIERILFLEGTADVASRQKFSVSQDLKENIQMALDDEYQVAKNLKVAIKNCEDHQDFQSRSILQQLLNDTEMDHINWLEIQLRLIKSIGIQNYIQSNMS